MERVTGLVTSVSDGHLVRKHRRRDRRRPTAHRAVGFKSSSHRHRKYKNKTDSDGVGLIFWSG